MEELDNLIKALPEVYQDIELNGKLLAEGKRDCHKRWEIIKPHINPHDVILDIGSSHGYYTKKIAREYPDSLVISFESIPEDCAVQKELLRQEGIYNVILCQHRLSAYDLEKWAKHADTFDVSLLLAVLHHFPEGEVGKAFEGFKSLSNRVITEIPAKDEIEACGGTSKEEAFNLERGQALGATSSHLGKYRRGIELLETDDSRMNLDAFFGVSHPDRHKFNIATSRRGTTKINGNHIIKGVNFWNLLHFNIVWPEYKWWTKQIECAYETIEVKSDVRPWNLLMTSSGVRAIDYRTKFPLGDQAEFRYDDIRKLMRLVYEMKPIDWNKL